MREAARLVKVKSGEEVETVTKHEVMVRQLWRMAMQGDLPAMRLLFNVMNAPSVAGDGASEADDETATLSLPARPDDDVIRRMMTRFHHLLTDEEEQG